MLAIQILFVGHSAGIEAGICMYHVTNVCSKDHKGKVVSKNHPNWTVIKQNVADDEYYDEKLVGLPVACFSTTEYMGGLPTQSPYPRWQQDGTPVPENTKHWRVSVPFNPDRYKIFKMAQRGKQIHLLCLDDTPDGTDWESTLVSILNMHPSLKLSSDDRNRYFPSGRANDYHDTKFFVNVCFITAVQITGKNVKWDKVPRDHQRYGTIVENFKGRDHALCLKEWGKQQLESIQLYLTNLTHDWEDIFAQCGQENSNDGPEDNDLGPDKDVSRMAKKVRKKLKI